MRATVAICYVRYFRAPPKGRDWYGRTDGVIAAIRKHLSTALAMELEYRCATARLASPHRMVQEVVEQANCSRLTNKVNVKDMVRHIYTETKRVMEAPGDPCPRQKWWFYHDALAQMCTPECR